MNEKHIDFRTVREELNLYDIENGLRLRAMQIITDIHYEKEKEGKPNLGFKSVSYVESHGEVDTSSFEVMPLEQITDKDNTKKLNFTPVREIVNIYETENSIILIDSRVENIYLTNKKEEKGTPILRFDSNTGISIVPKRKRTSL